MKQRISVRAIIKDNDKLLLLKRATGRDTILGKYELPGGKITYGEQPEDALRRWLHDDAGLHIQTAQLFDAVTYIDRDDSSIQYVVIVYNVGIAGGHHKIHLSTNYNKYTWRHETLIQPDTATDLTNLLTGILQQDEITEVTKGKTIPDDNTTTNSIIAYSDGGSRGNPGPSAAGFVLMNSQQEVIAEGGEYLGITTNNQAEYHGVRIALERAIELGYKHIRFNVDSMLVVNQMKGVYKIKNRELWPVHERIRELLTNFDKVTFAHVPRERNQLADGMVNRTLDQYAASRDNS